ncbi:beta-ketoacyl synthase N-terminal-like domain-containing protein (plasmid) [Streptomyces sp. HUAS MG91]|uniref:Beta-ketoacyl synthase N-terminal-like domain-containing protein n=1 Tax=Streptomyces tabacisoli TaxID=3156398 RepID=A0AAU8J601_9ACTN
MDTREILTRFKSGTLAREQAVTLLTAHPGATDGEPAPAPRPDPAPAPAPAPDSTVPVPDAYAITAVHGRFPYADDLDAYWRTALDGGAERRSASSPDPERFDAAFFGIDPDTAARLAPQERVLLETVWRTLEDAGHVGARLDALITADGEPRSVGVYLAHGPLGAACGGALPGRLCDLLGLRGPGHCVDTGASSFLAALHLATAALRTGDCAAALVAAVDAACAGAVLVRPLAAARAAGDTVHAVVRGGALAHAGRAADADARLARRARAAADLGTADIAVCETPVESGAAGAATGFEALCRAVLQIGRGTLLPAPGRTAPAAWPRPRDPQGHPLPRRASVAVRGEHGAAAHVILEEPPEHRPEARGTAAAPGRPELILLSAPTPRHLAATARRFADRLGAPADALPALADLATELRIGRAALPCRLALIVRTTGELAKELREFADGTAPEPSADLRGSGASGLLDPELPETAHYLAALRRGGRLAALARLWLAGVDVTRGEETHGRPAVPLPGSAMLPGPADAVPATSDGAAR